MNINIPLLRATSVLAAALWIGSAAAGPLADGPSRNSDGLPALAVNVGGAVDDAAPSADLPAEMQRQIALFRTRFPRGTAVIHTAHTYLYYMLGDGWAICYGIGVGRDGLPGLANRRSHVRPSGLIGRLQRKSSASPTCPAGWPAATATLSATGRLGLAPDRLPFGAVSRSQLALAPMNHCPKRSTLGMIFGARGR
jgi:hypothetical protein